MTIHKIVIPTPFAVGDVNAFLVKGDTLSLFDVGPNTAEGFEALKKGLKEAGYDFKDVEQIILTHHHPDHAGCLAPFENARIIGHPYNDLWLKRDASFFEYHDRFYMDCLKEEGVPESYLSWVEKMKRPLDLMGDRPLDDVLNEGDELPGHPGWNVLETLGHAQSHLSFYHETTGSMIGGDLVLEKISSNPLIEPPLYSTMGRPKSLLQYNDSLRRLLEIPVSIIYAGHMGEVRNVHELIDTRLEKQRKRAMKVREMLNAGPKTIFQLNAELFPTKYEKELGLTLSETIGQVDYLVLEGLATESRDKLGVLLYERT
ncbi:MBL fold metallo-hydrolase [Chungangia koreensis]|uniref:MBL fold metallo-hydrolase n=1 Tax=Chungangia koreensis TaxID=752657 RepID=A0ABV8X7X7_9LACT